MAHWNYQGRPYTKIEDSKHFGFIYEIKNIATSKKYIGQKSMYAKRGSYFLENDWQKYTGSNDNLNAAIKSGDEIEKNIIRFCKSKSELNYYETKEILVRDALLSDEYYNDWVSCKVTRKHLQSLQEKSDE